MAQRTDLSIIPIGNVDNIMMEELKGKIEDIFSLKVKLESSVDMTDMAYNPKRKQYSSSAFLSAMKQKEGKVLGVCDVDLYIPDLNFVFGEANPEAGVAIISLWRLRQERYGLPADESILKERALKEAVHELGHVFGLPHCPNPRCVMYFSNSLADTDRKEPNFCSKCQGKL